MLTVARNKANPYCDGISRLHFLRAGGLGMAALAIFSTVPGRSTN